jgi:hypothetical protein
MNRFITKQWQLSFDNPTRDQEQAIDSNVDNAMIL